jgi:hypothetical protein
MGHFFGRRRFGFALQRDTERSSVNAGLRSIVLPRAGSEQHNEKEKP